MDIFKQNKILISLVVILVIINLLSIIGIWILKFDKLSLQKQLYSIPFKQYHFPNEIDRLDGIAIELKFSGEQKEKYKEIRNKYHNNIITHIGRIHEVKKQIISKTLESGFDIEEIQNLFEEIGIHQAEIEKNLYLQYVEIKSICNYEQSKIFEKIINEIINNSPQNPDPPKID
ncbi:MAG: hypothetical protein N2490_03970 [Ignavibacteria bacterium]|nr:hypothetical protein [Ignavibacteria bacterium]